jgi:hypothetical protein
MVQTVAKTGTGNSSFMEFWEVCPKRAWPPNVNESIGSKAPALTAMEAAVLIRITEAGKAAFTSQDEEEENPEDNS